MKIKGILFLLLTLMSCQRDQITSIWVPKEESKAPASAIATDHQEITWSLPEGWTEQAPTDMRMGSFLVQGSNDQPVDVSVVSLSGMAGGILANINRWRGQIQLPPIEENDLETHAKLLTFGPYQMNFVNCVSEELLIGGKSKKRLVAAIYEHQGKSWFFKMTGEDQAVKETIPAFQSFLSHLQFHEHP